MYAILDKQKNEIREERFSSEKEALASFADYWREVALDNWQEDLDCERCESMLDFPLKDLSNNTKRIEKRNPVFKGGRK